MELQQLYSYTRRAISDYDMIQDGDKIAIGISGGKDSLCLLYALAGLRRFYPNKFELVAITVDLTNGEMDFSNPLMLLAMGGGGNFDISNPLVLMALMKSFNK